MEVLGWIVGIIIAYIIYAVIAGGNREQAYQQVIADLHRDLERNPRGFFKDYLENNSRSFVDDEKLMNVLMLKVIELSLERKIGSPMNANIIPSDITTLVDAKQDFEQLYNAALYKLSMILLQK